MFHSGKEFPIFLEYCFKQFRRFNPIMTVYFLTDTEHLENPVFTKYEVIVKDKDKYYTDNINQFNVLFGRGEKDFWTITSTRLFYIANFIKAEGLRDIFHFENDVLIFMDLSLWHKCFQRLYKHLAITIGGEDKAMTGFMFISLGNALKDMTDFFIYLLKTYSIEELKKQYVMDMLNEMTLMRIYGKEHPDRLIPLPILPFGEWSREYSVFHSIFDPASWGQFVGGTTNGVPGAKPEDHYIGQLLRKHPEYNVIWKEDDKKYQIPYFKCNGQEVKINNLHIHSKNLNKYMS